MNKVLILFSLFTFEAYAEVSILEALGLCSKSDGTISPLEKLVCESTPAMLEALNPSLEIPSCHSSDSTPKVVSGEKPVSAVFVSCTTQTILSCENIATSLIENQPGVTVNILVTSDGITDDRVSNTLLKLVELSKSKSKLTPLNILPINSVPDQLNISYMRDPGLFSKQNGSETTFTGLPYVQQNIPGAMIMDEAMKWCGLESTDTYKSLASFDTAYNSLTVNENSQSEEIQRHAAGLDAVNPYDTQSATMGGNFLALPNGTLVTGYNEWNKVNPTVVEHFSKQQKVMQLKLPNLHVGHIDEVVSIVPSDGSCGYAIFQASPHEAVKYLETIKDSNEELFRFFDVSLVDPSLPEKQPLQEKLRSLTDKKNALLSQGNSVPLEMLETEQVLLRELEVMSGIHKRTPSEIINDTKIMEHWNELEERSNHVVAEIITELRSGNDDCMPEVVKLPVFWDYTMARPLIPNPVNGLAINGTYFRSISKGVFEEKNKPDSRMSFPQLDEYIDRKISNFFPQGIQLVDTVEHNEGAGNFHCATTNIYLPCKN